MTERERLIELIKNGFFTNPVYEALCTNKRKACDFLADFLISNGVIVPPVKVGNMVYALWNIPTATKYIIYCAEVKEIYLSNRNLKVTATFKLEPIEFRGRIKEYRDDDFGKTVFLTREEAEKALKEREQK